MHSGEECVANPPVHARCKWKCRFCCRLPGISQRGSNKFEYYIANNTTGKSASGYVELDASKQFDGTTVEWVVERCKSGGSLTSLGDYGTMTMKNCKATLNSSNTWLNLGNLSNLYKVTMIGYGGNTLSSPGSISSGTQFTCTFKDYS